MMKSATRRPVQTRTRPAGRVIRRRESEGKALH
jgi:hypothetical protein